NCSNGMRGAVAATELGPAHPFDMTASHRPAKENRWYGETSVRMNRVPFPTVSNTLDLDSLRAERACQPRWDEATGIVRVSPKCEKAGAAPWRAPALV